ncbi:MAG: uracil-DNA glycosylase [Clostridia bacterium]|nr:uracil-DNA glycosylase [Clostridia bacterium]
MKAFNEQMEKESKKFFGERRVVFGEGKINAEIMLIGEAPGGEEDRLGRPFVGKAGKNLDEFLEIVGLEREDLYISNVVKLRPFKLSPKTNKPVNRPPNKEELDFFVPLLYKEIELVKPKLIVTLGNFALKNVLMNQKVSIGDYHGRLIETDGKKIFPLYHPASVIYDRAKGPVYIEDLHKLREIL